MAGENFRIQVECYAGYRGEETPRRFFLQDHKREIIDILDRWLAPDHRYFKVKCDNQDLYVLRHDTITNMWELIMFEKGP